MEIGRDNLIKTWIYMWTWGWMSLAVDAMRTSKKDPTEPKKRPKRSNYVSRVKQNLSMRELVPAVKMAEQISLWCRGLWQNSFHRNVFNFHFMQACSSLKFPCRLEMSRETIHPIICEALKKSGLEPTAVVEQPYFIPGYFTLKSAIDATWTVSLFDYEILDDVVHYKHIELPGEMKDGNVNEKQ